MIFSRRKFIELSALGAGFTFTPGIARGDNNITIGDENLLFSEPPKEIPIVDETDVIVCGSGPAGFAAALAAARAGASVRLFEVHGCLGGVWTSGMLTWLFDFDKPGIANELTTELTKRGARRGTNPKHYAYEIEEMKLLLEEKCVSADVKFQLFTRVVGAYTDSNKRLTTIVTESKSGRQAWKAKAFIDATGDGDLGALAGNRWDYGNDEGSAQPMTFMSLITVKDAKELSQFISFYEGDEEHGKKHRAFFAELQRAGISPSYGHPTLFRVRDNLLALMVNHEYGISSFDAEQITTATVRGRAEVNKVVKALRAFGGKWDGVQLVASCEQIGIREGRRLHGRYTVVKDDLISGKKQKDAVATVTFGADIHAHTKKSNDVETISTGGFKTLPYDIPLRSLIAKDVDGLMMAGRCISGDFFAHASYRVTGNAVAMGEASGVVAAIASQSNRLPHEIEWNEAKKVLDGLMKM